MHTSASRTVKILKIQDQWLGLTSRKLGEYGKHWCTRLLRPHGMEHLVLFEGVQVRQRSIAHGMAPLVAIKVHHVFYWGAQAVARIVGHHNGGGAAGRGAEAHVIPEVDFER